MYSRSDLHCIVHLIDEINGITRIETLFHTNTGIRPVYHNVYMFIRMLIQWPIFSFQDTRRMIEDDVSTGKYEIMNWEGNWYIKKEYDLYTLRTFTIFLWRSVILLWMKIQCVLAPLFFWSCPYFFRRLDDVIYERRLNVEIWGSNETYPTFPLNGMSTSSVSTQPTLSFTDKIWGFFDPLLNDIEDIEMITTPDWILSNPWLWVCQEDTACPISTLRRLTSHEPYMNMIQWDAKRWASYHRNQAFGLDLCVTVPRRCLSLLLPVVVREPSNSFVSRSENECVYTHS